MAQSGSFFFPNSGHILDFQNKFREASPFLQAWFQNYSKFQRVHLKKKKQMVKELFE